ncbi:hypothetical protein LVY72_07245 [Arthrobacter sp. I2-34]|uniref:L,D-peptidoglycan transpeptidase YkuD, ErfK/YbiS/YcfS/YnhG family n=1 Tax=Arthrobacter hankyongi TaxID=2904801 RepID=A0ABS9L512_9MICC|nr:hypothetical protein [Arthrobacter hankyongi]MCG2621711.1 hypothetical protein [Arthrobacter hankyongi]
MVWRRFTVWVASAVLAVPALLLPALPANAVPAPVGNPCQRLTAGGVRYPATDAVRVVFATAASYKDVRVLITGCVRTGGGYVQEWQTTGFAGAAGFAPPGKMWENTAYSPMGSFSFTEALGRSNPGTALEYHTVNPFSRWGGEHGPTYNQYFEGRDGGADEDLWYYMNEGYYEQAAVINWNREPDMPTVQGASFAIFFHVGDEATVGCIATDLGTVTRLLKTVKPGDRIIMGVDREVFTPGTGGTPVSESPRPRPMDTVNGLIAVCVLAVCGAVFGNGRRILP